MKRKEQIDQLRDMSPQELSDQADALKESLFRLKFRKTLARVHTLIGEKAKTEKKAN